MERLSTKDNKTTNDELMWFFVQPSVKQLTRRDWGIWLALSVVFFILPVLFNPKFFVNSPWTILLVLAASAFVFWLILKLKPHQQITYRIDSTGVETEFRSTVSPLVRSIRGWISLLESLFGHKDEAFINPHLSSVRHIAWEDIISVKSNPRLGRVTLQAGLKGKMFLWVDAQSYSTVLALVKTYTSST